MNATGNDNQARSQIRLLLDTSFCLFLIRTQPANLIHALAPYAPGEIAISSLTMAALQARVQASRSPTRNLQALEQFLLPLAIVDFDAGAAAVHGRSARWWVEAGLQDRTHEQLLAAHALHLNATLVTTVPERYAPAPGLRINSGHFARLLLTESGSEPMVMKAAEHKIGSEYHGVIVVMGSHDLTLDLLGDSLQAEHPGLTLVSAHVGSMGGLQALQQGRAHLAGSHLLDGESGEYNVPYVRRLLTDQGRPMMLVGFVGRVQGLIVARGNPKQITSLADLARADVRFVNRQPGAGTRVLLDYELARLGIATDQITGYDRQETSHMAVAMAVASGAADCALGIQAVARAHWLDFIPLCQERYDLVIPVEHYRGPLLAPVVELLQNPTDDFVRRVEALGGYDLGGMGKVLAEL